MMQIRRIKKYENNDYTSNSQKEHCEVLFLSRVTKSFGQLLLSYRGVKLGKIIHLSIKRYN